MAIQLDQIVPWGRSRAEYERMFDLKESDIINGVLDCGGGPSSFTAEVSASGGRAVSIDPLYTRTAAEIRGRFDSAAEKILSQVRAAPDNWTWGFHRGPDELRAHREAALNTFLSDYDAGQQEKRYIVGSLPSLPFRSGAFGVGLCSHLLFLYSDLLDTDFHIHAVKELCRVSREVRIFPLLNLNSAPSPHVTPVRQALQDAGWTSEIVRVNYELQRGGNQMLRVFRSALPR